MVVINWASGMHGQGKQRVLVMHAIGSREPTPFTRNVTGFARKIVAQNKAIAIRMRGTFVRGCLSANYWKVRELAGKQDTCIH
jgi:hypothetical protein